MKDTRVVIASLSDPQATARHYKDAFRTLGAEVLTYGPRLSPARLFMWKDEEASHVLKSQYTKEVDHIEMLERTSIAPHFPCEVAQTKIPSELLDEDPTLFLWIDSGLAFYPDVSPLHCPKFALVGDLTNARMEILLSFLSTFDHVFVQFDHGFVAKLQEKGISSSWLPPAAPHWFAPPSERSITKAFDIGFNGQTSPVHSIRRVSYLFALNKQFDLVVRSFVGEEYALFLQRCRIGFNCSQRRDLNMRTMEVLMSGALLLTDCIDSATLEATFGEERCFVMYENQEDLIEKTQHFLSHPIERINLSKTGEIHAMNCHTYENRCGQILSHILET